MGHGARAVRETRPARPDVDSIPVRLKLDLIVSFRPAFDLSLVRKKERVGNLHLVPL